METLGYLLGLVSYCWIWNTKLHEDLFFVEDDSTHLDLKRYRNTFFKLVDQSLIGKVLGCNKCLTGWLGIILFLCTFNIFFLSLPIIYKILVK